MLKNIIYVLKLEKGKFYVGKTSNLDKRINEHINGKASKFTEKYKFVELIEQNIMKTQFDEDNKVEEYMMKHRIENVRGGIYSKIELDRCVVSFLEKKLRHINNECLLCGSKNHFMNNCKTDL